MPSESTRASPLPDVLAGAEIHTKVHPQDGRPILAVRVRSERERAKWASDSDVGVHGNRNTSFIVLSDPVDLEGECWLTAPRPLGVSLAEAVHVTGGSGGKLSVKALAKVGVDLCQAAEDADKSGLCLCLRPETAYYCSDGSIRVVAVPTSIAQQASAATTRIADFLLKLSSETPGDSLTLGFRAALQRASKGNPSPAEFSVHLQRMMDRNRLAWAPKAVLVAAVVAMAAYAIVVRPGPMGDSGPDVTASAIDNALADAMASRRQWTVYSYANDVEVPPQAAEAEQRLQDANRYRSTEDLHSALHAYRQTGELFDAALATARAIEERRGLAVQARVTLEIALQPWASLVQSIFVELPPGVVQAFDARREADLRFLRRRYEESLAAYELSSRMLDSVDSTLLDGLQVAHEAGVSRQVALAAQETWARLREATDLTSPPSADMAKTRLSEAEALQAAGDLRSASIQFTEAAKLYRNAAFETLSAIMIRQEAADSRDAATQRIEQWRAVARPLGRLDAPEVRRALGLFDVAAELAETGSHAEARAKFLQVAQIMDVEREQLKAAARIRVDQYTTRIRRLLGAITDQQKELDASVTKAEERVSLLQQELGSPGHSPEELHAFAEAAQQKLRLVKVRRYCNSHVFSGSRRAEAAEALHTADELMDRGEVIPAAVLLEAATTNLDDLVRHKQEAEAFYDEHTRIIELAESTPLDLGTLARAFPTVTKLLDDAAKALQDARDLMREGDVTSARGALGDAELCLRSVPTEARIRLIKLAKRADAESRFDDASAALREVLKLDPDDAQAHALWENMLAHQAQPRDRITLFQEQLYLFGTRISHRPTLSDLSGVLGDADRKLGGSLSYVYDERGIMLVLDADVVSIRSMVIFYARGKGTHEPKNHFPGIVQIDGYDIRRGDTLNDINKALTHDKLEPDPRAPYITRLAYGSYKVRVNFDRRTGRVYTIAVDFQAP